MTITLPLGLEAFFPKLNLFPNFQSHYKNRQVKSLQILRKSENIVSSSLSPLLISKLNLIATVTDPSGIRFSVNGNVLNLVNPRSTWEKYFASALPVRFSTAIITIVIQILDRALHCHLFHWPRRLLVMWGKISQER